MSGFDEWHTAKVFYFNTPEELFGEIIVKGLHDTTKKMPENRTNLRQRANLF